MEKRPSFQFYPADWLRDAALRRCSPGARALWIDMLCIMHDGNPYGYLRTGDKDIEPAELSRMTGLLLKSLKGWLNELETSDVFTRTSAGTIYSRRMVRDEEKRALGAQHGYKSLENPRVPRPRVSPPSPPTLSPQDIPPGSPWGRSGAEIPVFFFIFS